MAGGSDKNVLRNTEKKQNIFCVYDEYLTPIQIHLALIKT